MKTMPLMAGFATLAFGTCALADAPTQEEMWQVIQQQQRQIEALQQELAGTRNNLVVTTGKVEATAAKVSETEQMIEATAEAVDEVVRSASVPERDETRIGGYGELHYNSGDKDEIDFHRFVLFFNHSFSDRLRFNSELELEHAIAGEGKVGEIELEQAYLEYDINPNLRARGGLFLVPVGIINETHEPPTFYGVERNEVEKNIIPATWWEGGAALAGELAPGWGFDLALHSGLKTGEGSNYKIRNGRQKVGKADLVDAAFTGRIRYTGVPGLELAATLQYQGDITQGADPLAGSASLLETHAVYRRGDFGLRALVARWDLDGQGPEAIGADRQEGWYVEPSWRINEELGVFARYAQWDNAAGDGPDSEFSQSQFGFNYWIHPNVVVKADYQIDDSPSGSSEDDRLNLGIGYQF
jgi:hypothetical protein